MALSFLIKNLNLPYLQGDLITDNKVNKPYYNQGQGQGQGQGQNQGQNQGQSQSHNQGQSQSQRPKRPKKGKKKKSNLNGGLSNDPNNSESKYNTSNPSKNQAHNFLIGNYLLKLNNSNSKRKFNSDSDSDSDSLVESDPFFHENRVNRPKKSGKTKGKKAYKHHKFNALLYDTGSTDHIINNRKWFVEFNSNKGKITGFNNRRRSRHALRPRKSPF